MTNNFQLQEGDSATVERGKKIRIHGAYTYFGEFAMIYTFGFNMGLRMADEAAITYGELVSRVDKPNVVQIRTTAIARNLNKSKSTIERHLAKIKELHIIRPDPIEEDRKIGQLCWRICPFIVWKGTNEELKHYVNALQPNDPWFNFREPQE